MPLTGQRLIMDPKFPHADKIAEIGMAGQPKPECGLPEFKRVRNTFWSMKWRSEIVIYEKKCGKISWGIVPGVHGFRQQLETLRSMDAWSIECESRAVELLANLVTHRQFKQYMLTGCFLELSKRSGVFYMFRRLRPTVAMSAGGSDGMRVLATLCMHPIAYYEGSWAGAMVPTDDVVAHLMLMRGDEHMYWRRANQHPAWNPNSGI